MTERERATPSHEELSPPSKTEVDDFAKKLLTVAELGQYDYAADRWAFSETLADGRAIEVGRKGWGPTECYIRFFEKTDDNKMIMTTYSIARAEDEGERLNKQFKRFRSKKGKERNT